MITELESLREILYHAATLAADPLNEPARREVRSAMKYYAGDDATLRSVAERAAIDDRAPIGDYAPAWLLQEAATLEESAKRQIITARRLRELYARHNRAELARVMAAPPDRPQDADDLGSSPAQEAEIVTCHACGKEYHEANDPPTCPHCGANDGTTAEPAPEPIGDPLTPSAAALIRQCAAMTADDPATLTPYAARQIWRRAAIVLEDARTRSWPSGIAEIARLVTLTSAIRTTATGRNRWEEIRHAARVLLPLADGIAPEETPAPSAAEMIALRDRPHR